MKVKIIVPQTILPKRNPEDLFVCECMFKPINLQRHAGHVMWLKAVGDHIALGEPVCEGDVDKKTVEFLSPCAGTLVEIAVPEGGTFQADSVLGCIEEEL